MSRGRLPEPDFRFGPYVVRVRPVVRLDYLTLTSDDQMTFRRAVRGLEGETTKVHMVSGPNLSERGYFPITNGIWGRVELTGENGLDLVALNDLVRQEDGTLRLVERNPLGVSGDAEAEMLHRRAVRATSFASRLAGPRRSHLTREWTTHLVGMSEGGITFSSSRQTYLALGFILAAARMRAKDGARPMWRPVDWLLGAANRTNAFIAAVVGAQAIYIVGDAGLGALVTEIWEPCGIAGAGLYALSGWLRRVRGVELSSPQRESADE